MPLPVLTFFQGSAGSSRGPRLELISRSGLMEKEEDMQGGGLDGCWHRWRICWGGESQAGQIDRLKLGGEGEWETQQKNPR